MTTWKNSGETSAKSCRKNEATSTSVEQTPVFVDRPQEPGDVEAPRQLAERGAPRHQHQPPAPLRQQRVPLHDLRAAFHRVVDEGAALGDTTQDEEAAVVALGDRRKLGTRQPRPAAGHDARL